MEVGSVLITIICHQNRTILFGQAKAIKNNRPIKYDVCIGQIDLAPGQTPKIQLELFIFMALALAGPGLF